MHVFPLSGRKKQEKKAGRTCSQSWSRPRDREYPSEMQSFRHEFKAFPPGEDAIAIDQMSPHVRFNCQTAKWIRAKWIRLCIPAARDARVVHQTCPSEDRGRREGRVLGSHPRPVCIGRKHTVVTTGGAGSSGLPCAMVLTASFELLCPQNLPECANGRF